MGRMGMLSRHTKFIFLLGYIFASQHVLANEQDYVEATFKASPTELRNSWQVNQINAPALWDYNESGARVKVAVIDTGIYLHSELRGRVLAGYNFINNRAIRANTSSDDHGHGTHVAGIIGASANNIGVVGVAPSASLIPIKVLDRQGSGSLTGLVRGIDFSVSAGANISSMSLSWSGDIGNVSVASALQRAVSAGQLIVIAAGNSGLANPDWPARYAKEDFANGQIIAVGAVDSNNQMPSWSNRAGDAANFYIVAPGVGILSTYNRGSSSYATMSGTSMATPVVSGAAALLKQGWNLSAQQIANILFTTATDLGTPGVDSTYGWGLLNVQRAMSPIGTPTFPTLTSRGISLNNLSSTNNSITPSAYRAALANANLKVAGLDDFGRDFIYDFSSLYSATRSADLTLSQIFNSLNLNLSAREYKTKDSKLTLAQIDTNTFGQANPVATQSTMTSMFYSKTLFDGHSLAFGINSNANHFFGFADTPFEYSNFISRKAFDNPYLAFDGYQNFFAYSAPYQNNWRLSAGMLRNFDSTAFQSSTSNQVSRYSSPELSAGILELSHQTPDNKLAFSIASTVEQAGLLGGNAGALFAMTNPTNTISFSLKNASKITQDTWVAMSFNQGVTLKNNQQASMVSSTSHLISQSWSLGLISSNIFKPNDRLGFSINQPLAVKSGKINLDVPIGLEYDTGIMQFEKRAISMAPSALEYDLEMTYKIPTSSNANLSLSALYRANPDNNSNSPDQKIMSMFWQGWF